MFCGEQPPPPTKEKLAKLYLQTLSEQRVGQDIKQTYKILNGICGKVGCKE